MGSSNQQDNLTAAVADQTVVIHVAGRGSFKLSPPMKQFILRMIESRLAHRILIDMSECCTMDSTFMGVLAGLSFHLKTKPGCTLKLINLSEKNRKLLTTLGVDRVVNYSPVPTDEEAALLRSLHEDSRPVGPGATDALEAARISLEAHETLVNIQHENLDKFKSVLELLKKDVDRLDCP